MSSYHSLAWKELKAQKITAILILIAIILSTLMTTVIGQSLGILKTLRQQQAVALNGDRYVTFHQLTKEQKTRLTTDKRISFAGSFINIGTSKIPNAKLSIWLREYEDNALSAYKSIAQLKKGRLPQKANELALPEDALKLLDFTGNLGDPITLPTEISLMQDDQAPYKFKATFILTGILENNYIGYVSGGVNGIVGQGTAETLLPQRYQLYSTDVRTTSKEYFQQIVNDITTQFSLPEYSIQYNDTLLTTLGISYTDKNADSNLDSGFSFIKITSFLIGTLVLCASGLVIYNVLKIAVTKRIRQYGTLRALGAESRQLYLLITLQLAILCGIGIPTGLILGIWCSKGITTAATGLLSPEIFLASSQDELAALIAQNKSGNILPLIISTVVTLLFSWIAALPAAHYVAKVSPTTVMSGTAVYIKRKNRHTLRINNFEAFYARLNMKRNKSRTIITILSLFMSITVFVALQSFTSLMDTADSIRNMRIGDYSMTNETIGFSPQIVEKLRGTSGIASVSTLKYSLYQQDKNGSLPIPTSFSLNPGEALHILGIDEERLKLMVPELTEQELQKMKDGKACLIKNPISLNYGDTALQSTLISKGETISITNLKFDVLHEVNAPVTLDNEGFVNGLQIIVYDRIYDLITGKTNYTELYPVLSSTADRKYIEGEISKFSEQTGGSRWLSYQETERQLDESYQQIKMLSWGLILFIGFIGILNIINTVYTNIYTRIAEIGVQRAMGMSKASLYKTFLWEGFYYGITGALFGSIAGYVCSIFVSAAKTDRVQLVSLPMTSILEATFISILACLIATCIPLRKIAKKSIVESIRTIE